MTTKILFLSSKSKIYIAVKIWSWILLLWLFVLFSQILFPSDQIMIPYYSYTSEFYFSMLTTIIIASINLDHHFQLFRKVGKHQRVISIHKSKKNRRYNDQKKKDKRTNSDLLNSTHKTNDWVTCCIPQNTRSDNSGAMEG